MKTELSDEQFKSQINEIELCYHLAVSGSINPEYGMESVNLDKFK